MTTVLTMLRQAATLGTMSTTLATPDIAEYVAAARARQAAQRTALEVRRLHAITIAHQAATALRTSFGATSVVLFGSALRPGAFHERSDIDLAAWGLTGKAYWAALAVLEDLDPTLGIDLVRAEVARPSLVSFIETEGIAL
jgi:predicted nucleotidyltransferase